MIYTALAERITAIRNRFGNVRPTLYGLYDIRRLYVVAEQHERAGTGAILRGSCPGFVGPVTALNAARVACMQQTGERRAFGRDT